MTQTRRAASLAVLLISCFMVVSLLQPAHANWTSALSSPNNYFARWSYVPDFDQRRLLLPSLGSNYCVPTASMNWMAYIAHHGFPGVNPPGDHSIYYWHSDFAFNYMTNAIYDMGVLMGTHEANGTSGDNAVDGIIDWLDGKGFGYYIYRYGPSGNYVPRFDELANWTLGKCPVIPSVGWYSNNALPPGDPSGLTLIVREGGHAVTLVDVARSGSSRQIGIRDPASDNSGMPLGIATQSPATTEFYAIDPDTVYLDGIGARVMDRVVGYSGGGDDGWIDGYTVLIPLTALTTVDDGLELRLATPSPWSWDAGGGSQVIGVDLPARIIDVRMIPGSREACVVTEGYSSPEGHVSPKVWRVNLSTEEVTEIGSYANASKIVFGRHRQMYVQDGRFIRCVDIDGATPTQTASVMLPGDAGAVTYNDRNDKLLVYLPGFNRIMRFETNLSLDTAMVWDMPPTTVVLDGNVSMAASPKDDWFFITSEGSQAIYRVFLRTFGNITVMEFANGQLAEPRGISVGDDNTVYLSDNGVMRVFALSIAAGGWVEDLASPFAGVACDNAMEVPYSRTNVYPPDPIDPGWFNVLPTQFASSVLDCIYVDADESGVVDFGDITKVLSNWLADYTPGSGDGDANGDGVVNFDDISMVLSNWLSTCP